MAFAGEAPVCTSGLTPCFPIGLPPPRFDLLTHHIASCVLSFKTVSWRLVCSDHGVSGCGEVNRVPSDLVKGFAFGQDCPDCSGQLVGQRRDHHAVWAAQ